VQPQTYEARDSSCHGNVSYMADLSSWSLSLHGLASCSWLAAAIEGCADSYGVSSSSAVACRHTLLFRIVFMPDLGSQRRRLLRHRLLLQISCLCSALFLGSGLLRQDVQNDPQARASSSQLDVSTAAPPFVKRYFICTLRHSSTSCRVLLHRALGTASTRQKRRIAQRRFSR